MWFFIMAELTVFGLFFAAYTWFRNGDPALFRAGQLQLNITSGLVNTAFLLLGSMAAAWSATLAQKTGASARQVRLTLVLAGLFGLAFLVLKASDFVHLSAAGLDMGTNDFWMFYFSLTVFHFLHVVLGMVILTMVWMRIPREGTINADHQSYVETGASYWHMVDLVWLVLFALVYIAH